MRSLAKAKMSQIRNSSRLLTKGVIKRPVAAPKSPNTHAELSTPSNPPEPNTGVPDVTLTAISQDIAPIVTQASALQDILPKDTSPDQLKALVESIMEQREQKTPLKPRKKRKYTKRNTNKTPDRPSIRS